MIPSDVTSQTQAVVSEIELLAEETRKMQEFVGIKANKSTH